MRNSMTKAESNNLYQGTSGSKAINYIAVPMRGGYRL
jgi:hypothetical protein